MTVPPTLTRYCAGLVRHPPPGPSCLALGHFKVSNMTQHVSTWCWMTFAAIDCVWWTGGTIWDCDLLDILIMPFLCPRSRSVRRHRERYQILPLGRQLGQLHQLRSVYAHRRRVSDFRIWSDRWIAHLLLLCRIPAQPHLIMSCRGRLPQVQVRIFCRMTRSNGLKIYLIYIITCYSWQRFKVSAKHNPHQFVRHLYLIGHIMDHHISHSGEWVSLGAALEVIIILRKPCIDGRAAGRHRMRPPGDVFQLLFADELLLDACRR